MKTRESALIAAAKFMSDGMKPSEIGELLGVHRGTIWRWSKTPIFRAAYEKESYRPSIRRFNREFRRRRGLEVEMLQSGDPYAAQRAAAKIMRNITLKDLLS